MSSHVSLDMVMGLRSTHGRREGRSGKRWASGSIAAQNSLGSTALALVQQGYLALQERLLRPAH